MCAHDRERPLTALEALRNNVCSVIHRGVYVCFGVGKGPLLNTSDQLQLFQQS